MKNNDPRFELIQACRDGQASQEDVARLEEELKSDAEFRRLYLSYMNIDHALTTGWREISDQEKVVAMSSGKNQQRLQRLWNPLVSAAAGLVAGIFFVSIAWAVVAAQNESSGFRQSLFKDSFESPTSSWKSEFPAQADEWGGDVGEVVLGSQDPAPEDGNGVARIDPAEETRQSFLHRILNVAELPKAGPGERRQLEVFASYHAGKPGKRERYVLRAATFADSPESIRSIWDGVSGGDMPSGSLTLVKTGLTTKTHTTGWQDLSASVEIPAEARSVVITLAAGRLNRGRTPKSVHYFDNVQADLIIEPQPTRSGD